MATKTGGTNATTSCTAIQFLPGYASGVSLADMATMEQLITPDNRNLGSLAAAGGRIDSAGILFLPGDRGQVVLKPTDWLFIDNRGWPFVVRADSIANGAWTHS